MSAQEKKGRTYKAKQETPRERPGTNQTEPYIYSVFKEREIDSQNDCIGRTALKQNRMCMFL